MLASVRDDERVLKEPVPRSLLSQAYDRNSRWGVCRYYRRKVNGGYDGRVDWRLWGQPVGYALKRSVKVGQFVIDFVVVLRNYLSYRNYLLYVVWGPHGLLLIKRWVVHIRAVRYLSFKFAIKTLYFICCFMLSLFLLCVISLSVFNLTICASSPSFSVDD